MNKISTTEATTYVRKQLDELGLNPSDMYAGSGNDNASLDDIILRQLPDAINEIVEVAPAFTLEPIVTCTATQKAETIESGDAVGSLTSIKDTNNKEYHIIRIVKCKAIDSNIIITESIPEVSPEGRMQLNPYIRGVWDNPILVLKQGHTSEYNYFTHKEVGGSNKIEEFSFIPKYEYMSGDAWTAATASDPGFYKVPSAIKDNILNRLAGLVLTAFGQNDKASFYYARAEVK